MGFINDNCHDLEICTSLILEMTAMVKHEKKQKIWVKTIIFHVQSPIHNMKLELVFVKHYAPNCLTLTLLDSNTACPWR